MARATLEMFLKVTGVNKASKELGKVSKVTKDLDKRVKNSNKSNAKFSSGMSSLGKLGIAGAAIFAAKSLVNFTKEALNAAVAGEEAASAFGTVFAGSAEKAGKFLEEFSNKAGLTVSEAQQLTAILGSVAQGIGFTADEAADLAISMTTLAADIASFMNVSQGAAPVLQSFQRALVGERESLATYGIKISELEVQTKALMMTSKKNAVELTRQEKGYATIALITQKAGVMVGDLDRTLGGFANQSRMVGAEIRELKEDIGRQLIPAAEAMLPVFRDFVEDIAPGIIKGFASMGTAVVEFALVMQYGQRVGREYSGQIKLSWEEMADAQREYTKLVKTDAISTAALQEIRLAGVNNELFKQRQVMNILLHLNTKYGKSLEKTTNPQLKKMATLLGFINKETDKLKGLTEDQTDAQKDFNRVAEKEALVTAQEALRKKELTKEIQELLFYQNKGVDVAAELAVKQEELKLVELELTRESGELIDATDNLAEANSALDSALNGTNATLLVQIERAIELRDIFNSFAPGEVLAGIRTVASVLGMELGQIQAMIGTGWQALVQEKLMQDMPPLGAVDHTYASLPTGDFAMTRNKLAGGGGDQSVEVEVVIREETMQEIVARANARIQLMGDDFVLTAS